jgi:oxygen-dependent protoporphyrinogen oxidase
MTQSSRNGRIAVIGAGVAGLAAARELRSAAPGATVLVLERSSRPGGLVATERTPEGFVLDHGPDSLVPHEPGLLDTLRELGLTRKIVASSSSRRSYFARGTRLDPLPAGLFAMSPATAASVLASPWISGRTKARLFLEPFVPPKRTGEDESVGCFFTRRFGDGFARELIDPLMAGIYGTSTSELSMAAAMPRLASFERRHGSVALGVSIARLKRRERVGGAIGFEGGMADLVDAMAADVRCGAEAVRIEEAGPGLAIRLADGSRVHADAVVIAAPAFAAARLVERTLPEAAELLAAIEYAPQLAISMGFARRDIPHDLDGTGFLVPASEGRSISACTWVSRKWPLRAPAGYEAFRVISRMHDTPIEDAVASARSDLRDLLGIEVEPTMTRVMRNPRAIARRLVGHMDRVAQVRAIAESSGRYAFAGNALGIVGVGACIESGRRAARAVALARRSWTGERPSYGELR